MRGAETVLEPGAGFGPRAGGWAVLTAAGWGPAFFLLAAAFLTGEMGCLPAALQRFGGLLALSLAMGLHLWKGGEIGRGLIQRGYEWEAAAAGLVSLTVAAHLDGLVGVCLALWGLERLEHRHTGQTGGTLRRLLVTLVLYSILLTWTRTVPGIWYALCTVAAGWSAVLSYALHHFLRLGPSVLGLSLLLLCLLYAGSLNRFPGGGYGWRLAATLAGVLVAPLLYWGFLWGAGGVRGQSSSEAMQSWLFQAVQIGHLLLFGLACLPTVGFSGLSLQEVVPASGRLRSGFSLLALTFSFFLLRWPSGWGGNERGQVIVFDGRPSHLVSWAAPTEGFYGERSGGMYGMWPAYLKRMGFTVRKTRPVGPLRREDLAGAAVFVTINPDRSFRPHERQLLWGFVAAGGGLLVLGEHTGGGGNWRALNELLQPFDIHLNFDTAWPTRSAWVDSLEVRPPATAWMAGQERSVGIEVGASLTVRPPAWPLVVGRFGWADSGNWRNVDRAYLGDSRWTFGERLGDLVLAAAERYGQGKVVVFGDTSTFQNTTLQGTYPFVHGLFRWLCQPEVEKPSLAIGIAGLLLLGALLALWPLQASSGVWILAVLAIWGTEVGTTWGLRIPPQGSRMKPERPVAYIDAAHLNRFSNVPDSKRATWGLTYNLIRAGYLPLRGNEGRGTEIPYDARWWIIIAPLRPYSKREIAEVHRFAQRGGRVLVTVGYEEAESAERLLSTWRCRIGPTPLGSCDVPWDGTGPPVHFYKAWPVEAHAPGAKAVLTHLGYPVVVFCPEGSGGLLVIGDSDFLLNGNLEGKDGFWPGNIRFLRWLLTTDVAEKFPS